MGRTLVRNGNGSRSAQSSKYDAHHTVLSKTYGALADLRRELSDSRTDVADREDRLKNFAVCADSQRAWLLLEDYFEKLSLSRKDFPGTEWWPRLLALHGPAQALQYRLVRFMKDVSVADLVTPGWRIDVPSERVGVNKKSTARAEPVTI